MEALVLGWRFAKEACKFPRGSSMGLGTCRLAFPGTFHRCLVVVSEKVLEIVVRFIVNVINVLLRLFHHNLLFRVQRRMPHCCGRIVHRVSNAGSVEARVFAAFSLVTGVGVGCDEVIGLPPLLPSAQSRAISPHWRGYRSGGHGCIGRVVPGLFTCLRHFTRLRHFIRLCS